MRDPTMGMTLVGGTQLIMNPQATSKDDAYEMWHAMIDEALAETEYR
jgi:hypothetical protein